MDIADHQSSCVAPSASWTRFTSFPWPMMVPAAKALSRTFASAAVFLSISAHCARGIAQFPTYEYIGGFSLTSCACAEPTATAVIVSAHTAAQTTPNCLLIIFFSPNSRRCPGFHLASWATQVYTTAQHIQLDGQRRWDRIRCTPESPSKFFP